MLEHPGGVRVGDLAKLARLSRPATSHHLKVLQDAGLVDHYQQGTKNFYHASARLDRWAQLARVTAHAEQFVRLVQELDARAEAGKHACSESGSGPSPATDGRAAANPSPAAGPSTATRSAAKSPTSATFAAAGSSSAGSSSTAGLSTAGPSPAAGSSPHPIRPSPERNPHDRTDRHAAQPLRPTHRHAQPHRPHESPHRAPLSAKLH
ncbi:ArsR family transcriptional regulator [Enorma massiliensis]|uniref:ArsR/SmtB family transcription factor n=1 Tax=Enorma massiliensis TaxID=1472761 RepID=UPI003AF00E0D